MHTFYETTRQADMIKECKRLNVATKEEVAPILKAIKKGRQQNDIFCHNGKLYIILGDRKKYILAY